MKKLTTYEIRRKFIEFFIGHDHKAMSSASLVPQNDPTLLFTNAGMNQFKNVFLGLEDRPYKRAVSSQKCVRAGGKHNDLENVGYTARHHTFFEMLGNFSFGEYFKKDAIRFAWEFITKELGVPKDRLYVSVFETDDEAAEIWHKQEGLPKDRIYRFGEKDNFWRMGNTGPCGPCSEIFYDMRPEDGPATIDSDEDRFVEIWNLVFMQFFEDESGKQTPLPNPSIDTGAGLERLAAVLQGETNNYHTDTFAALINKAQEFSGQKYDPDGGNNKTNVAFRVVADHARATAFLIGDGVLPSNEGRGYVLRRIMRRAIRYGRNLTDKEGLFSTVVDEVINQMGDTYTNLHDNTKIIVSTTKDEEKRFLKTLDQGTEILENELKKLKKQNAKELPGQVVFRLYDTFGFPADLTRIMANEQEFTIDEDGFEKHMENAKETARASWKGSALSGDAAHIIKVSQDIFNKSGATEFLGYGKTNLNGATAVLLSNGKKTVDDLKVGETGFIAFDKTSFYAESGGQVGDNGKIQSANGEAEVIDCTNQNNIHIHHIKVVDGTISNGTTFSLQVTDSNRRNTMANHSATHLMHAALREVLGEHVTQAGSLVETNRLRFDFTHNQPLTIQEIEKIESLVNQEVSKSIEVATQVMNPEEAKKAGALALFGEKYGDEVRVVQMGEFSMELCGGTHVANTAMIRIFKIVTEAGVSSGVRRIEALTGDKATEFMMKATREYQEAKQSLGTTDNWMSFLESETNPIIDWAEKSKNEFKKLQKQVQSIQGGQVDLQSIIDNAKDFSKDGKEGKFVWADIEIDDRKLLSDIGDKIRDKIQSGVVVIIGKGNGSHPLIVNVTKNLTPGISAGKILKEVASELGGKGGGRPDFAQGAASDLSNLKQAHDKALEMLS